MLNRSVVSDTTSDDSSEVDVNRYPVYLQINYGGQNFYMNRERFSATSSEQGVALFNDARRVDQLQTESTLSPLSVASGAQLRQALRMEKMMDSEFWITLFV